MKTAIYLQCSLNRNKCSHHLPTLNCMRWSVWVTDYNLDKVSHHLSETLTHSVSNHTLGSEIGLEHFESSMEKGIHIWRVIWLVGSRLQTNMTELLRTGRNCWLESWSPISISIICYFAVNNHNPWHQGNCTFAQASSFLLHERKFFWGDIWSLNILGNV